MVVYKGFLPSLICRDYQFKMGFNVTEKANYAHNGFRCVESPLDCLSYYRDINHAKYYTIDIGGDIGEDGVDSKVSCTGLAVLKRLIKEELFLRGLVLMADHPKRKWNSSIKADKAETWNGYIAVRSADPIAKRTRNGDALAFTKGDNITDGIQQVVVTEIDEETLQPGTWYGVELERRVMNQIEEICISDGAEIDGNAGDETGGNSG